MSFLTGLLTEARALRRVLIDCADLQSQITKGLNEMGEKTDKVKKDLVDAKADVDEIMGDLSELLDKIASFEGLPTAAEFEEIQTLAADLKTATRGAADVVPEAEPEL